MRTLKVCSLLTILAFSVTVLVSASVTAEKKEGNSEKKEAVVEEAAEQAPVDEAKVATADLKKLSQITGFTSAQLSKMKLDTDTVLKVYAAGVVSGSSFMTVLQYSDQGKDLTKFYKRNYVSANAQTSATEKYTKLKGDFFKQEFKKDSYEGINKQAVSEVISSKLGVSKNTIMEYGFGSGLPLADILACAAFVNKTGNSMSTVLEKRKQMGSMDGVYKNYATNASVVNEINALTTQYSGEMNAASTTGAKQQKVEINDDLKNSAKKLSAVAGVSKDKILDEMKNGNSMDDIKKAIAMTGRLGVDFSSILRLKVQGGWTKVKSYYNISDSAQLEINKEETALNNKLNPPPPPPQPADKKE